MRDVEHSNIADIDRQSGHHASASVHENDGKTKLQIDEELTEFIDAAQVRQITIDIKNFYKEAWPKWKYVDKDVRKALWEKFEDRHYWANNIPSGKVYDIYNSTASAKLSSNLYEARKKARKDALLNEPHDVKEHGPAWIPKKVWVELITDHWSGEDWEKKSTINSANRKSQSSGGLARHSAGSNSFKTCKYKLEKNKGKPISQLELFEHTHQRKGSRGEFLDLKTETIRDKYKEKLVAKYGEDLSKAPTFDRSAWLEAVGGPKGGRVFGTGESSRKFAESIHSASSVTSTERTAADKEPVEAVVGRRLDGLQEQINLFQTGFQEQMTLFQNQLGCMMQMMISQFGAQQRPSGFAAHPPFQPQMMTSMGQFPFSMQPQMTRPTNDPSSSQQWQQMYRTMGSMPIMGPSPISCPPPVPNCPPPPPRNNSAGASSHQSSSS